MASATPDLRLPSQPKLVLIAHTTGQRDGQAELTWVAGYIPRQFIHSKTVTHPGTNRAQRRVTTLIETNALPLVTPSTIMFKYRYKTAKIFLMTSEAVGIIRNLIMTTVFCHNCIALRSSDSSSRHPQSQEL